ncbi:MAG: phospholipase D-like domain-containing protein, partial [Burkholderia sp.]
ARARHPARWSGPTRNWTPVGAVALNHQRFSPQDLDQARDALREHWRENAAPYDAKPLNATPLAAQIADEQLGLVWAKAEFEADSPEKITMARGTYQSPPMQTLAALAKEARREFLVFSPYFVPHDAGVEALGALTARGVRVAILTNSLVATDAVAVQAGYAPYRVPLLRRGVELYEFRAEQPPTASFRGCSARARAPACMPRPMRSIARPW